MATNNAVNTSLSGQTGTGNFVGATSPTLITPNVGVATATSVAFSPTTNGIIGTTTNDNAAAGYVGEFITSTSASTGISNNTNTNITTISLTAGDWDVWGVIQFNAAAGTITTVSVAGVSSVSATFSSSLQQLGSTTGAGQGTVLMAPTTRFSLSTTTTIYLVGYASFSVSTINTVGILNARRMR